MAEFDALEAQLTSRLTAVADSAAPPEDAWERLVERLEAEHAGTARGGPARSDPWPPARRWTVAVLGVAAGIVFVLKRTGVVSSPRLTYSLALGLTCLVATVVFGVAASWLTRRRPVRAAASSKARSCARRPR